MRKAAILLIFALAVLPLNGLRTSAGNNYIHTQLFTGCYMAVTSNTASPSASDTTLASEITTPSGMARQAVTVTHTTGTSQTLLSATFTNSTGSTITIYKAAVFTASTSGTMISETFVIPASGSGIAIAAGATQTINLTENY